MKFGMKKIAAFIFIIIISLSWRFAGSCGAQDDLVRMQQEMEKNDAETAKKINETLKEHGYETTTGQVDVNSVMQNFQETVKKGPKKGKSEGMSFPTSEWYWFFVIFLSIVGMGFFSIGKKTGDFYFILSGLIMMVYPYFVTTTWIFITIGIALTIIPIFMTYKQQ
ncbi:MAG TPA: hypothetical protein PKK26_09175 [Candidatus Wallbacteria bacterium]|nr:hypothetical protein [Candidatus Wallbacteria bacterium]